MEAVTAGGRDSLFFDESWLAPDQPAAATGEIGAGETLELRFDVRAPDGPGGYSEPFALEVAGQTMRPMGLDLEIEVYGDAASSDDLSGGGGCCSAGGAVGAPWLAWALLLAVIARVRRRRIG